MRLHPLEQRQTVLALLALLHFAAQRESHALLAVADAEDGAAGMKNSRVDLRAAGLVDAVGSARDDEPLASGQLARRSFTRTYVRINAQVANFPRDQMAILPARIEDGNLWCFQTWRILISPVVAAQTLDDQLLGFVEQGFRLRNRVHGLRHHGIGLNRDLLRILVTEAAGVHFALQLLLDPGFIVGPVGFLERDVLLHQVLVKFVQNGGIRLPTLGQLNLRARAEPLRREIEELE